MSTIWSTEKAMRAAIAEAYKGAPHVSPNPLVGCVVLNERGEFLQSGYHEFYGGPHAEVNALKGLSAEQLKNAHVIVTLEPCAHEGKTPSCAKMLAKWPLRKVTFGLVDPNPLVAGEGAEILKRAGIEAEVFQSPNPQEDQEIKAELEEVCEVFLKNFREKKVFVALKMASSLDGQVALKSGESQWITGPESREYVHYLRSCYDAILVGKNTISFDDPSLNIRHPSIQKENKVIVLDPEIELLASFDKIKLATVHKSKNIFWCVAAQKFSEAQKLAQNLKQAPQLLSIPTGINGELDLRSMLQTLWDQGLRSVMIEGGAFTAGTFLREQLVDRLLLFQAPILMGAGGSISWTSALRIAKMQEKLTLDAIKTRHFGRDIHIAGRVNYGIPK